MLVKIYYLNIYIDLIYFSYLLNNNYYNNYYSDKHQNEVFKLQEKFIISHRQANLSHMQVEILKADTYKNGYISRDVLRVLALELLKQNRHYVVKEDDNDTIFKIKKVNKELQKINDKKEEEISTENKVEELFMGMLRPKEDIPKEAIICENISTSDTILQDIELLLDKCIMTPSNQIKYSHWSHVKERQLKLCETIPFQQYDTQLFTYLVVNWIADLDVKRLIA